MDDELYNGWLLTFTALFPHCFCKLRDIIKITKKHNYVSRSLYGTTTVANITFASGTGGSLFFNAVAAFSYSGAKRLQ